ncbi:hypothetical protein DBR43_09820 [Pedobacter sp. KBW06]|uniref:DUF6520 family protein n=1 Tax=Pedobacter sp. KBW06 TaxID=2153359 RepID=UPI000F5A36F3|nr:DUF6520 family protein [Pedobacter sp. KBW06]RQO75625.1 hypothetical protein DBR43_09820 [Pedobacter sp. KBW06]
MIRTILLSAIAMVAVGSAFASYSSKNEHNLTRYQELDNPAQCTEVTCSDIEKAQLCSTSSQLYLNSLDGVCTDPANDDFIYRAD